MEYILKNYSELHSNVHQIVNGESRFCVFFPRSQAAIGIMAEVIHGGMYVYFNHSHRTHASYHIQREDTRVVKPMIACTCLFTKHCGIFTIF